ncbi:MAG: helix-turn-helix domain-containing protein [Lysobacteraceae bacterium]
MDIRADHVKDLRTRRGWTQSQLAEVADLSLRTIQRVENQGVASNETVSALCAVLEVDREALLRPRPDPGDLARAQGRAGLLVAGALVVGSVLGSTLTAVIMRLW